MRHQWFCLLQTIGNIRLSFDFTRLCIRISRGHSSCHGHGRLNVGALGRVSKILNFAILESRCSSTRRNLEWSRFESSRRSTGTCSTCLSSGVLRRTSSETRCGSSMFGAGILMFSRGLCMVTRITQIARNGDTHLVRGGRVGKFVCVISLRRRALPEGDHPCQGPRSTH
ncbi:hypothetical protein BJ742DRAFT_241350 [Cladochytrium replicatum]|nr:hypothetical protein BJ742DRAFT_241350 [Cladochytrium replicatum]